MLKFLEKTWKISDVYSADAAREQKSYGCSVSLAEIKRTIERESIHEKWKSLFKRDRSTMEVLYVTFVFNVTSDSGHSYRVLIKTMYDPHMTLYMRNSIKIFCGCADFKFGSAYELEHHGALYRSDETDLKLGPSITVAPKRKRGTILCKHAFAALGWLINNYQNLMSNV